MRTEGPRSTGCSSASASRGRDVGPCGYRILTGTTCWSPDHSAYSCYRRLDDLHRERFGPHTITLHWPPRLRQRTAATAESHLPGLGPFPAARVEICVSSPGACVVSSPGASGASSYFFRDCTNLTPLRTPITVALADPSVGPVVARSTTTLPCPAAPFGFLTGYYTPSFSRNLEGVSHLGVVTTFPLDEPVASCIVGATGALLATFHREPGSGLPESLAPLPRSPAPPCTPCIKGRQRAAPHSSSFPPTTAPFQTLTLDANVPTVLEPWLLAWVVPRAFVGIRLHSDRGGELSSTCLETLCQGQGIQSYTLPASLLQNGVAEQHIGLVMEVARNSMCCAGASQFLWPQAVRYAAHELNLWPSDARPRVTPVSLWTGSPGVAADFRVWGSLAHVRAPSANKLSPRTCACVFLGFPFAASRWVFYDPNTYQFFASQDVTFDESVCYYRTRPHRGVSHVTPQSPPTQRAVPVVSGGAGGTVAEGEGTGAAGAGGVGSRGAGGVDVEVTPVEDTALSTRQPRPASPSGFPSVPQFPPRVGGGGAGSGGAEVGGPGTVAPTPRSVCFLTREQRLLQLEREERERVAKYVASTSGMGLVLGGKQPITLIGFSDSSLADDVEPLQSTQVYCFSLGTGAVSWRSTRALSVFSSSCEAKVYAMAMAAQELRWLSSLLVDLGERPRSPLVLFADNSLALCLQALTCLPLVTTFIGFASSHPLDYAAQLVSGLAHSPSSGGALVFSLEILEDRQFELRFLAAAVPYLCAMLLAPEGDPNAFDILIPCNLAEAVSRPLASYWIAAEEAEMATYRSTDTYRCFVLLVLYF
ncbi:unnamed protein product [Closterium sp. NIES-53]